MAHGERAQLIIDRTSGSRKVVLYLLERTFRQSPASLRGPCRASFISLISSLAERRPCAAASPWHYSCPPSAAVFAGVVPRGRRTHEGLVGIEFSSLIFRAMWSEDINISSPYHCYFPQLLASHSTSAQPEGNQCAHAPKRFVEPTIYSTIHSRRSETRLAAQARQPTSLHFHFDPQR